MQLSRSSTSVGANYEEAQGATSKRDFSYKIGISYREARESVYWLRVLKELYIDEKFVVEFEDIKMRPANSRKFLHLLKSVQVNKKSKYRAMKIYLPFYIFRSELVHLPSSILHLPSNC